MEVQLFVLTVYFQLLVVVFKFLQFSPVVNIEVCGVVYCKMLLSFSLF